MNHVLPDVLTDAYDDALFMPEHDARTSRHDFPPQCPWSFEEAVEFAIPDTVPAPARRKSR